MYLKINHIIIYNIMDITKLIEENENLKTEIIELKEQLKKYTYGNTHKRYYEKNKEKVKEGGANYLKKLKEENPEKLKEYRRTAYLNKKNKLKEVVPTSNILNYPI
jgi:cell division septum initiation protein DivIVA